MPELTLSAHETSLLHGDAGPAAAMAMRIIVAMADIQGAAGLLPVTRAHIDGCLYHGRAGLDFATRLADLGARVVVPTTLNVSSLDLLHPELYRGDAATGAAAQRQMDAYLAMGCSPTWTCAPYQLPERPAFGEHIAWAESNAIVFANSVLGARTNRYGDFIDICAAITGRVPATGLHLEAGRRARVVFDAASVRTELLQSSAGLAAIGHVVGALSDSSVVAITGVSELSEDQIKALGAAAASSGGVALIHIVGLTPEAPTLADATQGHAPDRTVELTAAMLRAARDELSTGEGEIIEAVSLGTPHASLTELHQMAQLLGGRSVASDIACYVSTGRDVLSAAGQVVDVLQSLGVRVVTDTCTYITPILEPNVRTVMTDSAKWAYYAPGNIGVATIFGSMGECLESAVAGRVVRDRKLWDD